MPLYQNFEYPWIMLHEGSVNLAAAVAGTYVANLTGATNTTAATVGYPLPTQWIDPADYAIAGRTMQVRLIANFQQNAVANAATSVATAGLYPVVPGGATTVWTPTLGTLVTGSTAANTGGAINQDARVMSATFIAPAADSYTLGVVVSVATTAGGRRVNMRLEYRMI